MVQSGFFWVFLCVAVGGYWLTPTAWRPVCLTVLSIAYLSTLAPLSVLAVCGWSLVFFFLAVRHPKESRRRTLPLVWLILGILSYLAYYKYIPPLHAVWQPDSASNPLIPLGISYFTFKLIHYAVEVRRGAIEKHTLGQFMSYMLIFPIFTAGPIERFDHFQESRGAEWSMEHLAVGSTRIVHGLIKKVVIAEMVLRPAMRGFDSGSTIVTRIHVLPFYKVWVILTLYYLLIYMDFSAYSDIAIGCSRLFGIRIMENFRLPVLASNLSMYWKRWHISLSSWCQTYAYMPMLGLTRNPYIATYTSFLVMGLWHAGTLNRVGWGLYQATGVAIYMRWSVLRRKRKWKTMNKAPWSWIATVMTVGFIIPSGAFLIVEEGGHFWDAIRILGKLCGIDLPAT
jgi:alginate O-acetyltransferase complex protein AlgI